MVVKLYGSNLSPPARYAALVLLEKKVPFELVTVDLRKGDHKSPAYLATHPFGQIPCLDDDGFIVYESRAIARYIATKYANQGPKLIPTGDAKELALFEQATFVELTHFNETAFGIFWELVAKSFLGQTPDEAKADALKTTFFSKMDVYEQILSKQKYIAGNELTIVDIAHLPLGNALRDVGVDITQGRPHVAKWFNELSARESWQAIKAKGLVSFA